MQLLDRGRDKCRSRSRSRSINRGKSSTCWYHLTFGQAARMSTILQRSKVGKRVDSPLMAAEGEQHNICRLYITDLEAKLPSGHRDLCVYPWKYVRGPCTRSTYELPAANGTTIHTYGQKILSAFQQEKPGVTQCDTERYCKTQLHSLIGTQSYQTRSRRRARRSSRINNERRFDWQLFCKAR